jgi:hypothetical protein
MERAYAFTEDEFDISNYYADKDRDRVEFKNDWGEVHRERLFEWRLNKDGFTHEQIQDILLIMGSVCHECLDTCSSGRCYCLADD